MTRNYLLGLFACAILQFASLDAAAQCPNNNSYYTTSNTGGCPGSTTVTGVRGGRYVRTSVVLGNTYLFSTCGDATFDTQITLYNDGTGAFEGYNDDYCGYQSQISWVATFTGPLRVLVDRYNCSNTGGGTTTTLNISCSPAGPTNDDPCIATSLTVGTSCTTVTSYNSGATPTTGVPAPSCSVYGNDDIWFTFVAPASGSIGIETTPGILSNGAMALYKSLSCSGPFTELECDDDDGYGSMPAIYHSGLSPGTTYYVRFWGILGDAGTFDICAYDPADCKYTLHLFDSGADGWDGAVVELAINGGSPTTYTLTSGDRGEASFDVNIGDNIEVTYRDGSGREDEISYILALGDGSYFNDGPNPTVGVVFTHVADCVKPSAPIEDCIGSATLCDAQTINVNPMNVGITTDLNAVNRGCLGSNERQGQWYNFTPTAGGTIEMDIIPVDPNDDYDFAIWGPYSSLSCVPPEAPLRCSYSDDPGTTGLKIGAGDTSEDPSGDKYVDELKVLAGEVYMMYVSNWSQTGIASDINFTLSDGALLDCTILPIELLTFSATPDGNNVMLKWATSSETDNEKFIIERSRDATFFEQIGVLPGAGNSFSTIEYSFTDQSPMQGINYYRLRQVDFNGAFSNSQVVTALIDNLLSTVSDIYPNPATSEISFNIESIMDAPASVLIFDASGRMVQETAIILEKGTQRVDVELNGLQQGSYSIQLIGNDGVKIPSGRFIVN